MIRGSVDGFEGTYLTGWAVALPDGATCGIRVLRSDGRPNIIARASRARPDLAALGLGRTNFAFRIPIESLDTASSLRVLANDVELPGSPVKVGPGLFDGSFAAENGFAQGWVTERRDRFAPPFVRILDQAGDLVAEGATTIEKAAADLRYTPAVFRFALPARCYGRPHLHLRAFANGMEFATAECTLRLEGFLDGVWAGRCAGWLVCPDVARKQLDLEVLRDGRVVGRGRCDIPRPDLKELFPASWEAAGFDIALSPVDRELVGTAELSVRLAGSDRELFGGPFLVGPRAAGVVAAQRLARQALGAGPGLDQAERAVLQMAVRQVLDRLRQGDYLVTPKATRHAAADNGGTARRLNIIIPIYKGIEVTRACIESVLRHRCPERDAVILINDRSPEPGMAPMLQQFIGRPDVFLMTNEANIGFVRSVNRGLSFCHSGDVVLLNSDTCVFAGGLDELWRMAQSAPEIGSVTAISNNATIFSYPHPALATTVLEDVSWEELAAVALRENRGRMVDVPTGHGFCMLVRRQMLDRVPLFNEQFGRGYGEENEMCLRAADLGFRHVAAAGALVEHRESISFGGDKAALLSANLPKLEATFPEYTPAVMDFEKQDGLRSARWALDAHRLRRAAAAGLRFAVVVENWLEGGTRKAARDIEKAVGYGEAVKLELRCTQTGTIELLCQRPLLRAVFLPGETDRLFDLLAAVPVETMLIHQLLGFPADFVRRLGDFAERRQSVCYIHDFFPICPRVTMIDAVGQFCGGPEVERCGRCVALGGVHEASVMGDLTPAAHLRLFAEVLPKLRYVVAPSGDAAAHVRRALPGIAIEVIPHPRLEEAPLPAPRQGGFDDILLLGAIGPHKGSARLHEIARQARLTHPWLRFHVIGHTDIDAPLQELGNVVITGPYEPGDLPDLVAATEARVALFLHGWPETFSYTLTEAISLGLLPVVPDIGAPAERVRDSGYGVVFPFPITAAGVLGVLDELKAGRIVPGGTAAAARAIAPGASSRGRIAELLGLVARPRLAPEDGDRVRAMPRPQARTVLDEATAAQVIEQQAEERLNPT